MTARTFLNELFQTAIAAAHPSSCLPAHLPEMPKAEGRLIVLAAGKAAGSMAEVAEAAYADAGDRLTGIAVAREG
jgi:glycerate 2-kinase